MVGRRGILLVVGLTVAGGAQAQQQGEFMRNTLSTLGLIEPERPSIAYRERAPLVMPPKLDGNALPAPQARGASPQWPKDPEVRQRERALEEARRPTPRGGQGRYNDNNATLTIDEMRSGRRAGAEIPTEPVSRPGDNTRESTWLNPFGLLRGEEKTEPADVEPQRDALTDPPTEYRRSPRAAVRTGRGPVSNPFKEREEADPGAYMRSQGR